MDHLVSLQIQYVPLLFIPACSLAAMLPAFISSTAHAWHSITITSGGQQEQRLWKSSTVKAFKETAQAAHEVHAG